MCLSGKGFIIPIVRFGKDRSLAQGHTARKLQNQGLKSGGSTLESCSQPEPAFGPKLEDMLISALKVLTTSPAAGSPCQMLTGPPPPPACLISSSYDPPNYSQGRGAEIPREVKQLQLPDTRANPQSANNALSHEVTVYSTEAWLLPNATSSHQTTGPPCSWADFSAHGPLVSGCSCPCHSESSGRGNGAWGLGPCIVNRLSGILIHRLRFWPSLPCPCPQPLHLPVPYKFFS